MPNVATIVANPLDDSCSEENRGGLWAGLAEFPGNGQENSSNADPEHVSSYWRPNPSEWLYCLRSVLLQVSQEVEAPWLHSVLCTGKKFQALPALPNYTWPGMRCKNSCDVSDGPRGGFWEPWGPLRFQTQLFSVEPWAGARQGCPPCAPAAQQLFSIHLKLWIKVYKDTVGSQLALCKNVLPGESRNWV